MNPLDAAWLLLKGIIGSPEDKARGEEQAAEWAKIQENEKRRLQQEEVEDPGFGEDELKTVMEREIAELKAAVKRLEEQNAANPLINNTPPPVDGEPVVE